MIFIENNKDEQIFTMQKMLPIAKEFLGDGYSEFGFDWCLAMWGTKWDIQSYRVSESGDSISISYITEGSPNTRWVEAICQYILVMSYPDNLINDYMISVSHSFYQVFDDCGVKMEWTPAKGYNYMEGEILRE